MKKKPDRFICTPDCPKISPPNPDPIQKAGCIIQHGGVVCFPTTGLYGLAADATNPRAIDRIYRIKQRPDDKPVLILIQNMDDLDRLVTDVPETAKRLIQRFWPGHVTLIMTASPAVSDLLTAQTGKIGIRLPLHPVAKALMAAAKIPITGTSANISGQPGCSAVAALHPEILQSVDMILDAGQLKGGAGSTVVDVTENPVRIIREGSISAIDILDCANG